MIVFVCTPFIRSFPRAYTRKRLGTFLINCIVVVLGVIISQQSMALNVSIILGDTIQVGAFDWYRDGSTSNVVRYLYSQDIDADGVDEVFIAGFETQPNSPETYSNTSIHIFGWKSGEFQEITTQWLPDNNHWVEGVGDLVFGDFNSDGLVDVFLSAYSDMDHVVNSYQLINRGSHFDKEILGQAAWEHGAFAFDLNQDGYQDVFMSGYEHPVSAYIGGPSGLQKVVISGVDADGHQYNSHDGYGSGVGVADFLGDGSVTAVIVDAAVSGGTRLVQVLLDQDKIPSAYKGIADLPAPTLDLVEWQQINQAGSHTIRAEPLDFSGDGLMDVLVFGRGGNNGNGWAFVSAVQFLKNNGDGSFEDVTSAMLPNYEHSSGAAYAPVLADFNQDGEIDLFVSEVDFQETHQSTAFLMQKNGQFVESGRNQIGALMSEIAHSDSIATIAKGPNNQYYIVWDTHSYLTHAQLSIASVDFDSDGDGVSDRFDVAPDNSNYSTDDDGDLLPDEWETRLIGNLGSTSEQDNDGDGIDNLTEYSAGTDPLTVTAKDGYNEIDIDQAVQKAITDQINLCASSPDSCGISSAEVIEPYQMRYGWNLVGGIDAESDVEIESFLKDNGASSVWGWDGQWKSYIYGVPAYLNSLGKLSANSGYFVNLEPQ